MTAQLALPEQAPAWLEALLDEDARATHYPTRDEHTKEPTMNKVILAGRLTRDPEMRALASGKHVTQFSLATTEYAGNGQERPEYHNIVVWDRLAEVCGRYLGKGQQVAIEGRLVTRTWDDDKGLRHWKTEIVASAVEMLSGRKKKDYEAETAPETPTEEPAATA